MPTRLSDADLSLAGRDDALPYLAAVLDDDRLSELVGENIRITRVRYKPHTSVLVAFCCTGDGTENYGWALTSTTSGYSKLNGRAQRSASDGGGIRLVRPDPRRWDSVVAIGGFEDDWTLRKNLDWLRDLGLDRLGAVQQPGQPLLTGTARVLRYIPECRLVFVEQTPGGPIVIRTAAQPVPDDERMLLRRLELHGVPVLRRLGDADCSRHGISASPVWGAHDLSMREDPEGARRAGKALAILHGIPVEAQPDRAEAAQDLLEQLTANRDMITALLPSLAEPAAKVALRIYRRLEGRAGHGTAVVVHGDFSADQVLVGGSEVRLIDFDRSHLGAPEADLGSFAAVEEMSLWREPADAPRGSHTNHLLDGYAQAGGGITQAAVDTWMAFRMFTGAVDPFRNRSPDWAADMCRHIDRASELIP
ncbi:phosphotransferase family protein [Pseudarthrobacter sp. S9]|uniref:phosphotransferase family protein n=1 Tax=Pseudarthrobacter sp. S9 TaxID=3418421 RepID=UPI003D01ADBB